MSSRLRSNPAAVLPLLFSGLYLTLLLLWLGKNRLLGLDESWYADMAKAEVLGGHWFPLDFQGHPFWDKPPLLPWLQGLCLALFGMKAWALRLPSALAGAGTVLFAWRLGARWGGSEAAGLLTALGLALEPHFILSSRVATLDMPLAFCLSGFAWAWTKTLDPDEKERGRGALLAGLFTALAVFVKSWAGLIMVPAALLGWALRRGRPDFRGMAPRFLLPIGLALAAWLSLYGLTFGMDYFRWEWGFNLGQRIGSGGFRSWGALAGHWDFYAALAQEGLPFLWPLLPLGLSLWVREARGKDWTFPLFLASYSAVLLFFMSTLINYFLPWVVVFAWSAAFLVKDWTVPQVRLAAAAAVLGALWYGWGGGTAGPAWLGLSAAVLAWIPLPASAGPGRPWVLALAAAWILSLGWKAQDYLRHPPDPNRAWVAAVLAHPAAQKGEPLLFVGEETDARALEFYSDYRVVPLERLPPRRPKEALLFADGPRAVFLPAAP